MDAGHHVLILGATGRTGGRVLSQLLDRGWPCGRSCARPPATAARANRGQSAGRGVEADLLALPVQRLAPDLADCDTVICGLGHPISPKGVFGPPRDLVAAAIRAGRGRHSPSTGPGPATASGHVPIRHKSQPLRESHPLVTNPQPHHQAAKAILTVIAESGIRRALAELTQIDERLAILPAAAEVAIACGEFEVAESCVGEIESALATYPTPALRATAHLIRGCLQLAQGSATKALPRLRAASDTWRELGAPYEAAAAGLHLAEARRSVGDEEGRPWSSAPASRPSNTLVRVPTPTGPASCRAKSTMP